MPGPGGGWLGGGGLVISGTGTPGRGTSGIGSLGPGAGMPGWGVCGSMTLTGDGVAFGFDIGAPNVAAMPPMEGRAAGDEHARRARQDVLVVLLHAVLSIVVAVDEAEQMGSQGGLGSAARLRIDPLRLRLEGDVDDPLVP